MDLHQSREGEAEDEAKAAAIREAFCRTFSVKGIGKLDPGKPLPTTIAFTFIRTRPTSQHEGKYEWIPTALFRCPAAIEMNAQKMLRKGCTLDVAHARVKGIHQAMYALSDDQLQDDWEISGHTKLTLPPNPIGWALDRAAERFGITCRQWMIRDGTRVWNEMRRETKQAEIALSMPPGTVEDTIQAMEGISMEDLTDIREIMEEMGLDNWEDPAEDPAGVEIERQQINDAMSRFNTRDAAMKFIAMTAKMPEYQREQVWAEMLHHARAGDWKKIPEPIREWSRQVIEYIDQGGPKPDYWPDKIPW